MHADNGQLEISQLFHAESIPTNSKDLNTHTQPLRPPDARDLSVTRHVRHSSHQANSEKLPGRHGLLTMAEVPD